MLRVLGSNTICRTALRPSPPVIGVLLITD
jgi:hypothetical protein